MERREKNKWKKRIVRMVLIPALAAAVIFLFAEIGAWRAEKKDKEARAAQAVQTAQDSGASGRGNSTWTLKKMRSSAGRMKTEMPSVQTS